MRDLTIHVLWQGRVLCKDPTLASVPAEWPEKHKWVGADTVIASVTMPPPQAPHGVNCMACLGELANVMTLVFGGPLPRDKKNRVGSFEWAVAFKRPMRRAAWLHHKPIGDEKDQQAATRLLEAFWVFLRVLPTNLTESLWIRMTDGAPHRLVLEDYLAADWEVM